MKILGGTLKIGRTKYVDTSQLIHTNVLCLYQVISIYKMKLFTRRALRNTDIMVISSWSWRRFPALEKVFKIVWVKFDMNSS